MSEHIRAHEPGTLEWLQARLADFSVKEKYSKVRGSFLSLLLICSGCLLALLFCKMFIFVALVTPDPEICRSDSPAAVLIKSGVSVWEGLIVPLLFQALASGGFLRA